MKFLRVTPVFVAAILTMPCWAVTETVNPSLGKRWFETQLANPESKEPTGRQLVALPDNFYKYSEGNYQSVLSRMTIAVPVIGSESQVSVRESVVSRRPNGVPITSHVMFIPGAIGAAPSNEDGVSAVVVTLLREDRPKDSESVLRSFEPTNDDARKALALQGMEYNRLSTNMGVAVQRIVRNRLVDDPFPYLMRVRAGEGFGSFGVTRYVVAPNDSLIEFSQVVPCGGLVEGECKQKALTRMNVFMAGVREFLLAGNVYKQ